MTNSAIAPRPAPIDSEAFRDVAGRFASGLTILTSASPDGPCGTTVSAVSSLSLEPPMMLVCLNRNSSIHDAVLARGAFGINILAADQAAIARQFARRDSDKFAGVAHRPSRHGVPLLDGTLASIACEIESTATGGTHTVLLGRVLEAVTREIEPLVYYRGGFGEFAATS